MTTIYMGKLVEIGEGEDWREYALCSGVDPALWDAPEDRSNASRLANEQAVNICFDCPVMQQCEDSADDTDFIDGVRAGWLPGTHPVTGRKRMSSAQFKPNVTNPSAPERDQAKVDACIRRYIKRNVRCSKGHVLDMNTVGVKRARERYRGFCRVCSRARHAQYKRDKIGE